MRVGILLVLPSYVMLQTTWSATRYFFSCLQFFLCFPNEWIWIIMILSGRRVEPMTLAYS